MQELRSLAPEGTSESKLQGIVISCRGNRAKMSLMIEDLWNSGISIIFQLIVVENNEDGWEEIETKSKTRVCIINAK